MNFFSDDARRIGFFGLGKTNLSLLSLPDIRGREVVLRSDREIPTDLIPRGVRIAGIYEGARAAENIREDMLLFSPSVKRERPEFLEAEKRGVTLSSDAEMFFNLARDPIFAVTGSDGKSTTTAMTHALLCERYPGAALCGNIGEAMTPMIGKADAFAVELSSFQLTYSNPRVSRGAITNLTENHLDWHGTFSEYKAAKLKLAESAEEFVLNADDGLLYRRFYGREPAFAVSSRRGISDLSRQIRAKAYYTLEDGFICRNARAVVEISKIKRNEPHNLKNLMMAMAMCDGLVSDEWIKKTAAEFAGLDHRCQTVAVKDGITYIDSSIDTTPARTASTLCALKKQVVIILGGRGKGLSAEPMLPMLKEYAHAAVVYGESRSDLMSEIGDIVYTKSADSFDEAVRLASALATDVGAVLLSPAATSYGDFPDFNARGNRFKELVSKL